MSDFNKWVDANLPGILTTISMIAAGATAITGVRAGIKCKERLDELPEDADTMDKIRVCAPEVAPVVICAAVSAGTSYAAHHEHAKRYMALASTLAITQKDNKYLREFQKKAEEKLGIEKTEEVKSEVKQIESDEVKAKLAVAPDKMIWVHDLETGHMIYTTMLALQKGVKEYNQINKVEVKPISEFYRIVQRDDYTPTPLHEYIGCGGNSTAPALILEFGSELASDLSQVYTISYDHADVMVDEPAHLYIS